MLKGAVLDEKGARVTSFAAVMTSGTWQFYNEQGSAFAPKFHKGHTLKWDSMNESSGGGSPVTMLTASVGMLDDEGTLLSTEGQSLTTSDLPNQLDFVVANVPTKTDWEGSTQNVTIDKLSIIKKTARGWNTRISTSLYAVVGDEDITFEFKAVNPAANAGMHGLDHDYVGTSYKGGDYVFYISAAATWYVYENGKRIKTSRYTGGIDTLFRVVIDKLGVCRYYVVTAGTPKLVYTSTIKAVKGDHYRAVSFPYSSNTGMKDYDFTGSQYDKDNNTDIQLHLK